MIVKLDPPDFLKGPAIQVETTVTGPHKNELEDWNAFVKQYGYDPALLEFTWWRIKRKFHR